MERKGKEKKVKLSKVRKESVETRGGEREKGHSVKLTAMGN